MHLLEEFQNSIKWCTNCILSKERIQVVPWDGNHNADIVFIWEWPWKNEDIQWKPFVWAAWKFLNEMLASIWLNREDVFIANVVKCRPPNNRDPKQDEIKACLPYLNKQLEIIKPKIIVTLWRFSMNLFFPEAQISKVHWQILIQWSLKILILYHPAAALYNPWQREVLKKDFSVLKDFLEKRAN